MRTGILIILSLLDRERLQGLVNDRNAAQKHIWCTEIILLDRHERDHSVYGQIQDLRLALA